MASIIMIQHPAKEASCSSAADDELNATKNVNTNANVSTQDNSTSTTTGVVINTTLNNKEEMQPQRLQADADADAACLVTILLQQNETGIELFRHQRKSKPNNGDDDDKGHLRCGSSIQSFQQAASKLADCLLLSTSATAAQASIKMTDMLRQIDITATMQEGHYIPHHQCGNSVMERVSSTNSHQSRHDYEQTDLISLKGLPIEISAASAVVLHNLGLVLLAINHDKSLSALKVCLDFAKEQDFDHTNEQHQVLLSQVQASANYLMGLTLYKKSCMKVVQQASNKEETKTINQDGSKRRKVMVQAENQSSSAAEQQQHKMMLLYKSLEYVLDGLGAMNEYQSHLMSIASSSTTSLSSSSSSKVDTTSIPIGLFYILAQVYFRLNMRRDAQLAFQRCTWFVQSRQHQLVADEMWMGGVVVAKTNNDTSSIDDASSASTNEGSANVSSSLTNNNNKTTSWKSSPLTRNAAAA